MTRTIGVLAAGIGFSLACGGGDTVDLADLHAGRLVAASGPSGRHLQVVSVGEACQVLDPSVTVTWGTEPMAGARGDGGLSVDGATPPDPACPPTTWSLPGEAKGAVTVVLDDGSTKVSLKVPDLRAPDVKVEGSMRRGRRTPARIVGVDGFVIEEALIEGSEGECAHQPLPADDLRPVRTTQFSFVVPESACPGAATVDFGGSREAIGGCPSGVTCETHAPVRVTVAARVE